MTGAKRPVAISICLALLVLGSCRSGDSSGIFSDRLYVVSGDNQLGSDRTALEQPVIVEVNGPDGLPRPNVPVSWKVNDGGKITPAASRTDERGRAAATWTLGVSDEHEGSARLPNGVATAFTAAEPVTHALDLSEAGLLSPRTYDGSRQTVHPDFARTPADWGAYALHLALTPYPNGAIELENPSVFVSRAGYRWFPEAGVSNPLVRPTDGGYLSDPDLVFLPDKRELWMYYRQADTKNRISVVRSNDGITWTQPVRVINAANQTVVSPAIVRRGATEWLMWSVNGGALGCSDPNASVELRRSRNGIIWSRPAKIDLRNGELMPWHIDVQWIPELGQYWALYPAKTAGNCLTREVFLATSGDGVHWTTYPTAVLKSGDLPELSDVVYRSTFSYNAESDEVRFWFSGANATVGKSYNWRTVVQRRRREDVMARISSPRISNVRTRTRMLPPMIDPP